MTLMSFYQRALHLLDAIENAMGKRIQGRDSEEVYAAFGKALYECTKHHCRVMINERTYVPFPLGMWFLQNNCIQSGLDSGRDLS